ncbi:MAG: ATP-binding protein, partial [Pseudomonadota bacterium]|nr:ATP-binding protein [Pseudomonadota bacterium]
ALALVATGEGERLMAEIRRIGTDMETTADDRTGRARAQADLAARNLLISVILTSGLSVALLVLLTYFLRRDARRIRNAAEQLETTLRCIGDAVVTTDPQGQVTFLNPVALDLAQLSRPEMPAPFTDLFVLINEITGAAAINPIAQVLKDGKTIGLANHTALRRPDGTALSIEDSAAPLRDEDGKVRGVVFVFKDISARRRAEIELAAAQTQLEANFAALQQSEEELRAADRRKDEFLATLAHELRNPVAPIRHAIQLLENGDLSDEQNRWCRAVITRQVNHMARLLDDLLDSARATRGDLVLQRATVDLKSIITDALDVAMPLIERKQQTLEILVPEEPLTLLVDGVRMAQVLSNLLTNAAKYTDAGGRITLRAESNPDGFLMTVKDTGVGLTHEALSQVFRMFSQVESTLDRSEGGLGIGLSLASQIIELHGGHIEAQSEGLGHGSAFVISLPPALVTNAERPAPATPANGGERRAAGLILLIDDKVDAAASLGMLLELSDNEVIIAHSGEDGLKAAEKHRPAAIIVDIGLPGMNGYQVAQAVRAESWGAPVLLIALTGWGQTSDKERAKLAGFDHHLTKPADVDEVHALIRAGPAVT